MTQSKEVPERRVRTREMVDKWLQERQEMLVLYCQLAGLEPYAPERSVKQLLPNFCQLLVDYIAFGHFEVFERISRGEERRSQVLQIAEEVYPKIVEVADLVVDFNDKYESEQDEQELGQLDQDLSRLGAGLASRIEMEDRLVSALMR